MECGWKLPGHKLEIWFLVWALSAHKVWADSAHEGIYLWAMSGGGEGVYWVRMKLRPVETADDEERDSWNIRNVTGKLPSMCKFKRIQLEWLFNLNAIYLFMFPFTRRKS